MKGLLIALTSFGAAGLELAEAGLLLLVVIGSGFRRAAFIGAAIAGAVVIAVATIAGAALLSRVPVTGLRLYLGIGLAVTGLALWGRALLSPEAANKELAHESEGVRHLAKTQLLAGMAAAKIVLIEGSEATILTVAIGAPRHDLLPAVLGAAAAAICVCLLVARGQRLLDRIARRLLDRVAGTALVLAGSLWIADATGTWLVVASAALVTSALWRLPPRHRPLPHRVASGSG